jgi:hypothetical protein
MGEGELKKRIGKGKVMVGEPYEGGWYEDEGFVDPNDYLIVDDEIVVPKEKVFKILDEVKAEFPEIAKVRVEGESVEVLPISEAITWFKKWFGETEK